MGYQLDIQVYNEMWIDCRFNTIMSALIAHNNRLKDLPCFLTPRFTFNIDVAENLHSHFLSQGFYTSNIKYDNYKSLLYHFIEKKELFLDFDIHNVIKEIKSSLIEGFYVYVYLDRYYYPNGLDSGRTHVTHPSFIYGFDDYLEIFYALEDVERYTVISEYKIPYRNFSSALRNQQNENQVRLQCFRVREVGEWQWDGSIYQFLLPTLEEGICDSELDFKIKYGLSCINLFSETLHQTLPYLENYNEFMKHLNTHTYYHQRNLLIIDFLHRELCIDVESKNQLSNTILENKRDWGMIAAQIMKALLKSKGKERDTLITVQNRLNTLFEKELRLIEQIMKA